MRWRLGVIGYPIEHSLSPQLHAAGLALAGLEGSSERLALQEGDADQVAILMGERFDALSVTMPLKSLVGRLCASLDPAATRTGMVNSLLWRDGALHGANTDGLGLADALRAQFDFDPKDARVLVLGAGGAARAIVDALVLKGASEIMVHARSSARTQWLLAKYGQVVERSDASGPVDLIVNTTPAKGRSEQFGERSVLKDSTIGVDITYEPRMSSWRTSLESAGCRSANGLAMLAYQAARQMQWWWGVDIDGAALAEELT